MNPNLVHDLPPFDEQRNLRVVVETPRGANIKLKFDEKLGCFSLTRILPLGVTYPYDFGFVPQTLAQDGDPIDVMILIDAVTYPGVVIGCRLIGALRIEERGMRGRQNHRLVAVPVKAARKEDLKDFAGLGERMQKELERFFVTAAAFTTKDPQLRGWVGPEGAAEMVTRAIQRYRERHQKGRDAASRTPSSQGVLFAQAGVGASSASTVPSNASSVTMGADSAESKGAESAESAESANSRGMDSMESPDSADSPDSVAANSVES